MAQTRLNRLQKVRLVLFHSEQKIAIRFEKHFGQRPLCEQGIGREEPQERVMVQQLRQAGFERLGFGRFAVGYEELSQTEVHVMGEDIEHVNGFAKGVVPLLAGLAVDGRDRGSGDVRQGHQPSRKGAAELLHGESGKDAAEGRGVRGISGLKAQRILEGGPMVQRPSLQAGHVGLTTEQAEKGQCEDRGEGMADAASLAGIRDLSERVDQRRKGCGHP